MLKRYLVIGSAVIFIVVLGSFFWNRRIVQMELKNDSGLVSNPECKSKNIGKYDESKGWVLRLVSDGKFVTTPVRISMEDSQDMTMVVGWIGSYCVQKDGKMVTKRVTLPALIRLPDGTLYRYARDDFPNWNEEEIEKRISMSSTSEGWNEPGGALVGGVAGQSITLWFSDDPEKIISNLGLSVKPSDEYLELMRWQGEYFRLNSQRLVDFFENGSDQEELLLPYSMATVD